MTQIELSPEEKDFVALVIANLKEKGLHELENLTQTNIKQAMWDVRERQNRLVVNGSLKVQRPEE